MSRAVTPYEEEKEGFIKEDNAVREYFEQICWQTRQFR